MNIPLTLHLNANTTFNLDPSVQQGILTQILPSGWCIQNLPNREPEHWDQGGCITIPGKYPGGQIILGTYRYGASCRILPGKAPAGCDPCNIFEVYVPHILSVASSTHDVNPVIAVRDRDDGLDMSMRLTEDKKYGVLMVGNLENGYPNFGHAQNPVGMKLTVDDGKTYRDWAVAEADGSVRFPQGITAANGRPGLTRDVVVGDQKFIIQGGLITDVVPV